MEYDLQPLRETQPSDLRADGIAQVPIMNFFSFPSSDIGRETEGNDSCHHGSFLGGKRDTLEFFFTVVPENFHEVNGGHFQRKKIFKKLEKRMW